MMVGRQPRKVRAASLVQPKKALEALTGVEKAEPSHEKKCAVLTLSAPVDEAAVKAAVTDAGYDYLGIE